MSLKQDGIQTVVISVDRCILLPACPLLEKLCSSLPADPDYVDCGCFRQRVCQIVSYICKALTVTMLFMQVTVTGVRVEAVNTLVELIYRGISNLEQVL